MPVIPVSADYDLWVDVRIQDLGRILPLVKRNPPEWVMAYPRESPNKRSRQCFPGVSVSPRRPLRRQGTGPSVHWEREEKVGSLEEPPEFSPGTDGGS